MHRRTLFQADLALLGGQVVAAEPGLTGADIATILQHGNGAGEGDMFLAALRKSSGDYANQMLKCEREKGFNSMPNTTPNLSPE